MTRISNKRRFDTPFSFPYLKFTFPDDKGIPSVVKDDDPPLALQPNQH
jgi:hypothetical protein